MNRKKFFFIISFLIFAVVFFVQCTQRIDLKKFIEMELVVGNSDDLVIYSEYAVGSSGKSYVPSQKPITGTVPIENEYNLELSAQISYDKNKETFLKRFRVLIMRQVIRRK